MLHPERRAQRCEYRSLHAGQHRARSRSPFSLDGFDSCAAFQLDLEKGADGWPDPLVLAPCRVECPIGGGKLSAQFRAVMLTAARRTGADRVPRRPT